MLESAIIMDIQAGDVIHASEVLSGRAMYGEQGRRVLTSQFSRRCSRSDMNTVMRLWFILIAKKKLGTIGSPVTNRLANWRSW